MSQSKALSAICIIPPLYHSDASSPRDGSRLVLAIVGNDEYQKAGW
jgi:hypothetical protein